MERPIKSRLRINNRLIPFLVGLLLVLMLFDGYEGWWAVFVTLGGAWLLSLLWARSLARGLDLKREVRFGWAQVGDTLLERFTLTNRGRFPGLWVEIQDHSTMPAYQASRAVAVEAGRSIRWHAEAVCSRRGVFQLGPVTMRSGDPLGLYNISLEYPTAIPLLVLPPVVPLPHIEVAAGGRAGERGSRSPTIAQSISASHVREYAPGDHHRLIHWRTTARQDSLFVRQLDSAQAGDWWIILDMHREVHLGVEENSTEEHQVVLAASLADQALRAGKAVGLAAADGDLTWLPPRGGDAQRWQILYSLALISQGDWPLSAVLNRAHPILGRNSSLTIITPSVDPDWVESLLPILDHGSTPTVLILDPMSFGGSADPGPIRALLGELGIASHLIPRSMLEEVTPKRAESRDPPKTDLPSYLGRHPISQEPWKAVL